MKRLLFGLLAILLFFTLTACQQTTATPTSPAAAPAAETVVAEPSATPVPERGKLVVVGLETWDANLQTALLPVVQELAEGAGLDLLQKPAAEAASAIESAGGQVKAAIYLVDMPNLRDLANANSSIQFVGVSKLRIEAGQNLNVLYLPVDQRAFAAGYMSVLLTKDRRGAGLFTSDEPLGSITVHSFTNGGRYLCGNCFPFYTPLKSFPQVSYQASAASDADWLNNTSQLLSNVIYGMYLDQSAAREAVMQNLIENGVYIYGEQTPPEQFKGSWAVTIGFDLTETLKSSSAFIQGQQPGTLVPAKLSLYDVNESILTTGKMREVQELIEKLESGLIDPISPQ